MYHVGGPRTGWSDLLSFRALKDGNQWSPRFAVYGDLGEKGTHVRKSMCDCYVFCCHVSFFFPLGNELGFSIPPLQTEAALGHFDAVLHVGDMAYDMAQDNARCENDKESILANLIVESQKEYTL